MSNNDTAAYVTRFNTVSGALEYAVGNSWAVVPGVGSSVTAGEINSEAATNGQALTANGSGGAAWTTLTAGANTALSNLSAVAINAALLPGVTNTIALGSASFTWTEAFARTLHANTNTLNIKLDGSTDTSVDVNFSSTASGNNEVRLSGHTANGIYFFATEAHDKGGYGIDNAGPGSTGRMAFSSDGFQTKVQFEADVNGVGISDTVVTDPNACSVLDLQSTTRGFLPTRMTTTQRDAIASPVEGLVIYNTTTHVLNFYNGSAWGAV